MIYNIVSLLKWGAIFYCVIFTITTIINSMGVLWLGLESNPDVHGHIILRAGVCFFITIIVSIIKLIAFRGKQITYIIVCVIALIIIMMFIWALTSGYLWDKKEDLHPNAFRDMTRSIAIPFALASIVFGVIRYFRGKREKNEEKHESKR